MPRTGPDPKLQDPGVLRAISHPLRNRILEQLYARGAGRAADLAGVLGVPANQVSFHLRQLARYELIEEAPELARDGRDRVWRPTHPDGLNIDVRSLQASPGGSAAVTVWSRSSVAQAHAAVDRAWSLERSHDVHVMISNGALMLTQDEAKELTEELLDLSSKWRERGRQPLPEGAEKRRLYKLMEILQPEPEPEQQPGPAD